MASAILDFVSQDKVYFGATKKPTVLQLGQKTYLSLDGEGTPESVNYHASIETIYSAAFQLKFLHKKNGEDFKVSKLECLWWVDEGKDFSNTPMEEWCWKLLIRIPDSVSMDEVKGVAEKIREERGLKDVDRIRIDSLTEGKCVQILHYGSYDKVGESYDKLLDFMKSLDMESNGPYHEIYISDPNRTAPERLKTVLRIPVR